MEPKREHKYPVGTVRHWESGDVIKATEPSIFDSGWINLVQAPHRSSLLEMDGLARNIVSFKEPVDGDLWLTKNLTELVCRSGKKYNPADFKQYYGFYGAEKYSFFNEFSRIFQADKIELAEKIREALLEANRLKCEEGGLDTDNKIIKLSKEEIKEIRSLVKSNFKYTGNDNYSYEDIEDIFSELKKINKYLVQGENFEGELKEVYDRNKNLKNTFLDEYQRVGIKRLQMEESLAEIDTHFGDNWGIKESFRKSFLKNYQQYIDKYRTQIERDELDDFKAKLGCPIDAPIDVFYKALDNIIDFESIRLENFIDKKVPNIYDKYKDLIYRGTRKSQFRSGEEDLVFEDPYDNNKEILLNKKRYKKDIEKLIASRTATDIDIPMKIRFTQLYNKGLVGLWSPYEVNVLKSFEKTLNFLPDGHFKTNNRIENLQKEGSFANSNSYAHYSSGEGAIFFSDSCANEATSRIDLNSGQEFPSVLMHEIGHGVSQKLHNSRSLPYRKFGYECGWSWTQFEGNAGQKKLFTTDGGKDVERLGPLSQRGLITEYAHKSPEEAFAEYYSVYSQYKKEIDHFLETGDPKRLKQKTVVEYKEYNKEILNATIDEVIKNKHTEVSHNIRNTLLENNRKLSKHITFDYVHPFDNKVISHYTTEQFTKKEFQENFKHSKVFPQAIFTIKNEKGEHTLLDSSDFLAHYGNRTVDGMTPTFSLSEDCYTYLKQKDFSDLDIRNFTLAQAHENFKKDNVGIEKKHYKPQKAKKEEDEVSVSSGLQYRSEVIPLRLLVGSKEIFKKMKEIWTSPELQKALEELGFKNNESMEDQNIIKSNEEQQIPTTGEQSISKSTLIELYHKYVEDPIKNLLNGEVGPYLYDEEKVETIKFQEYCDSFIFNTRGQLLLLRRSSQDEFEPGKWSLPGGKLEEGESPLMAAQRELYEETSLYCNLTRVVSRDIKGGRIHYFVSSKSIDDYKLVGVENDEHYSYQWVSLSDLSDYELLCDLGETIGELLVKHVSKYYYIADYLEYSGLTKSLVSIRQSLSKGEELEDIYLKTMEEYSKVKKSQLEEQFNKGVISEDRFLEFLIKGEDPEEEQGKEAPQEDDSTDTETEEGQEDSPNGSGKEEERKSSTGHSKEELEGHAQQASEKDLRRVISEHRDPLLREVAHRELKRRQSDEHISEVEETENPMEGNFNHPAKNKVKPKEEKIVQKEEPVDSEKEVQEETKPVESKDEVKPKKGKETEDKGILGDFKKEDIVITLADKPLKTPEVVSDHDDDELTEKSKEDTPEQEEKEVKEEPKKTEKKPQ